MYANGATSRCTTSTVPNGMFAAMRPASASPVTWPTNARTNHSGQSSSAPALSPSSRSGSAGRAAARWRHSVHANCQPTATCAPIQHTFAAAMPVNGEPPRRASSNAMNRL